MSLDFIAKRPFLLMTLIFVIPILLLLQNFLENVWFYASGSVANLAVQGQWWFAGLNIILFLSLLLFLRRSTISWKTHGIFTAFIVSLFVEMYGTSLFIYFISNHVLNGTAMDAHPVLFSISLLGIMLGFDLWMTFGSIIIIVGIAIIALGWYQLWNSKKQLFIQGLYQYSRHPQYVGFLYTVWGWMIAWPTITTLVFTPVLTIAYLSAAKKEEKWITEKNKEYQEYANRTPFLI